MSLFSGGMLNIKMLQEFPGSSPHQVECYLAPVLLTVLRAAGGLGDGGGVERQSGGQSRPHPPLQEPQRQAGGRHRDAARDTAADTHCHYLSHCLMLDARATQETFVKFHNARRRPILTVFSV